MTTLLCHLFATALAAPVGIDSPSIPVEGGEVSPFFSTQLRVSASEQDDWAPSVRFRRVRAGLKGEFAEGRLASALQLNLVPGATELIDLYGEYRAEDWKLRVGQFTIPFTRYREQSHRSTLLADWSIVAEVFGAERQVGAMLADRRGRGWTASLGVFTGLNARASNGVGLAEAFGIEPVNRSSLAFGRATFDVHPEIAGRVGVFTEGMDLWRTSHADREGTHVAAFLSAAVDLDPEPFEDFVARVAPEVVLQSGPFGGTVVLYGSWFEDDGRIRPAWIGGLVEAAYRFTDVWELAARGAGVLPSEALADATSAHDQWEAVVGVNAYLVGEKLKMAGDFGVVVQDGDRVVDSAPAARLQAQFAW